MATPRQRRRRTDPTPDPERFALSLEIREIARQCALRLKLSPEAAEDCASEFVARALLDEGETTLRPPEMQPRIGTYHAPWVRRCALNHAHNFRHRLQSIEAVETAWPEAHATDAPCDSALGPEARLMRKAVSEDLMLSVMRLDADPREFLLRHYLDNETIQEIAASCGRSPHAVEQCLLRARHRLRSCLERRGLTAEELRSHLCAPEFKSLVHRSSHSRPNEGGEDG